MVSPVKINFKVYQGSTFREVFRWESSTKSYAPITNITKTAPVVITSPNHPIPQGWRVKVVGVGGMKEINNSDEYRIADGTTTSTVTISEINAINYTAYTSGGVLEYNTPVDLTGFTGHMQIREKLDSATTIASLTSEAGNIVFGADKTIMLTIPATVTQTFNFNTAVYSLELIKVNEIFTFATGNITLIKEVTR